MNLKSIPTITFFFSIFVHVILSSNLSAQQDKKAEQVLSKSRSKVSGIHNLSANFSKTLEIKDGNKKPITVSGKFKLKKEKFRVDLSDQMVICNGKTVWSYLVNEAEVTVSEYDSNEGFSPDRMFKITQKDMNIRYDGIEAISGISTEKVTLFPKSKDTEFFKVEFWANATTSLPVQMKVWNRNGSVVTYSISNIDSKTSIPDTDFVFDEKKYPGVEVIKNK